MVKFLTLALLPSAFAIGATVLLACCLGPWQLLPDGLTAEAHSLVVAVVLLVPSALTVAAVEYWIWRRSAGMHRD